MTDAATTTMASIPCCPDMTPDDACDVLDFLYRQLPSQAAGSGHAGPCTRRGQVALQAYPMPWSLGTR